jgi:hypothetical protein
MVGGNINGGRAQAKLFGAPRQVSGSESDGT